MAKQSLSYNDGINQNQVERRQSTSVVIDNKITLKGILRRGRSSEPDLSTDLEVATTTNSNSSTDESSSDESFDMVVNESGSDVCTPKDIKGPVRFSMVEVREYPITVGVNPSCEFGPALELGWKYDNTKLYDVDMFEDDRTALPRRTEEELVLSSYQREDMLLESGFTMRQIWNKTHEKDAYRRGAEKSKRKNGFAKLKIAFNSIGAERKRRKATKNLMEEQMQKHDSTLKVQTKIINKKRNVKQ